MAPATHGQTAIDPLPRDQVLIPPRCAPPDRADQRPGCFPDIEWDPSLATYLERVDRLASSRGEASHQTVPCGFPAIIQSPRVWRGSDFDDESKYIYNLSSHDVEEICAAARAFIIGSTDQSPTSRTGRLTSLAGAQSVLGSSNPDPDRVAPETFPLPNLEPKLRRLAHLIHFGQAFFLIRGLDPQRLSPLERVIAYAGITSYVGEARASQDAGGSKLIHIKDRGAVFPGAEMRQAPYSNVAQPFHTDVCDILAMYVQEVAAEGGQFKIASSGQIYNQIAANRPDVIHTLAASDWVFDRFSDPPSWDTRPLLLPFGSHGPSFFYSRRPLTGSPVSPRTPGIPAMTERQAEALDMVHFAAVENQLSISAKRGDIILLNNLAVMHGRDAFVDGAPDTARQRHVMRLWLRNEQLAWPKPDIVKPIFDLKYSKDSPWCQRPVWHMEPPGAPERMLARRFNCS
ncbi:TauD/TfdA-like domain-containing protein [Madurella fahalii]|uniref:TauD/TfdA-like domain-containing protein n=1 Tax=Madurella fahalii TaxID=1157608 RepID=A0ABQ0G3W2_9PEZI